MMASVGTVSAGSVCATVFADSATLTNIPGASTLLGFASSTRALRVRVLWLMSGSSACTLPLNTVPPRFHIGTGTQKGGLALGDFRVGPYVGESIDAKERRPWHN